MPSPPQIGFIPFGEISGVYANGLTGVGAGSSSGGDNSFGVQLSGGVSGVHDWKHTKLGLDYRGDIYHFTNASFFDGSDQSLLFSVARQMTRHTTLTIRQTAGTFTQNFGLLGLSQTALFDPASSYVPTTDFFDNRTIYVTSQADFTVQKTARLSFNMGGDWFLNRRRSSALYGVSGATARGDVQYRMSRRTTVGAGYTYTHYQYHGVLSGTDLHGAIGTYAIRLTRTLELSAYGGVLMSETRFLQNAPLDPAIVALLGRAPGAQIIYRVDYVPNLGGRLSRAFRRGVAYVSVDRTVTPGNGLFLTSTVTSLNGGYTYTGLRRWSIDAQAAYTDAYSLDNFIGHYRSPSAGVTFSRRLTGIISLVCDLEARRYESGDFTNDNRTVYSAQVGLSFSPGEIPLRIW